MDKVKCSEFVDTLENLNARVNINTQYGDNDLSAWLIKNLDLKEGERVLDVGCGDGTHLKMVASIVKRDNYCTGIDYDLDMVNRAKSQSKDFNPRVLFLQMDMDSIGKPGSSFEDNSLDLIYSVYAFYYSKNEFDTLNALKRKSKLGGRVAVVGPHSDNNKEWFSFLSQFMKIPEPVIVSSTVFMEGIKRYADENFRKVKTAEFINNITLPSYDALRKFWMSNVYYDPEHDPKFEKYGRKHFEEHKTFQFPKKAQMVMMEDKKQLTPSQLS